jgi:hypothetical protein
MGVALIIPPTRKDGSMTRVATRRVATIPLMGASCAVTVPFQNTGAPKIQFIGDSITVGSTNDIVAHYGGSYDVAIDAYSGATAYEQMSSASTAAGLHPAIAVINLGTNDAGVVLTGRTLTINGVTGPWDPVESITAVEVRLDTMAAEFAPACVIVVTVNSQDAAWYGGNPDAIANVVALNAHIRSMPGVVVADWDAVVQPSDFDVTAGVSGAPHPNETGIQALLALEDQAIGQCPATSTTSTSSATSTSSTTSTTGSS